MRALTGQRRQEEPEEEIGTISENVQFTLRHAATYRHHFQYAYGQYYVVVMMSAKCQQFNALNFAAERKIRFSVLRIFLSSVRLEPFSFPLFRVHQT